MTTSDQRSTAFATRHGVQRSSEQVLLLQIRPTEFGLGIFAKTDIQQGDCLLIESSVLYFTHHENGKGNLDIDEEELSAQYAELTPQVQRDVMNLVAAKEDSKGQSILQRVAKVNSYEAEKVNGIQRSRVSLFFSRINHSCAPNAVGVFRQDIGTGTEVTISYLDDDWKSTYEKRRYTSRVYGFSCSCRLCMKSGKALVPSETRRQRLRSYWEVFHISADEPAFDPAADVAEEDAVTGLQDSMAEEAGDCCLLVIRHLNDLDGSDDEAKTVVDLRAFEAAQTAANNFETLGRVLDKDQDLEAAYKAWIWAKYFTLLAIRVGNICYGHLSDGKVPAHPTVKQLMRRVPDFLLRATVAEQQGMHSGQRDLIDSEAYMELEALDLRIRDTHDIPGYAPSTDDSVLTGVTPSTQLSDASQRDCVDSDVVMGDTVSAHADEGRKLTKYGFLAYAESTTVGTGWTGKKGKRGSAVDEDPDYEPGKRWR